MPAFPDFSLVLADDMRGDLIDRAIVGLGNGSYEESTIVCSYRSDDIISRDANIIPFDPSLPRISFNDPSWGDREGDGTPRERFMRPFATIKTALACLGAPRLTRSEANLHAILEVFAATTKPHHDRTYPLPQKYVIACAPTAWADAACLSAEGLSTLATRALLHDEAIARTLPRLVSLSTVRTRPGTSGKPPCPTIVLSAHGYRYAANRLADPIHAMRILKDWRTSRAARAALDEHTAP